MSKRPEPTLEGVLIKAALKRSGLSARKASERANISYGRWHQVVNGYQAMGGGIYHPVREVPAETIARMAKAVDLSPEQLKEVGRPDAATELRNLTAPMTGQGDEAEFERMLDAVPGLTTDQLRDIQIKVIEETISRAGQPSSQREVG